MKPKIWLKSDEQFLDEAISPDGACFAERAYYKIAGYDDREVVIIDDYTGATMRSFTQDDIKIFKDTGATDQHGNKIYVGNIVEYNKVAPSPTSPPDGTIGIVIEGYACFLVADKDYRLYALSELGDWEVVGHIAKDTEYQEIFKYEKV